MKKIYKSIKLIALLVACLAIPSLAGAQVLMLTGRLILRSARISQTRQVVGVHMRKPVIM